MMNQACQTPLLELLDDVPVDGRDCYEESSTSHHFIPYGRLCKEAADRIRELEAENNGLLRANAIHKNLSIEYEERCELLEAQLAELKKGEPVDGVVIREGQPTLLMCKHINPTDERLYLSPVIPEGWMLVPKEPTEEMDKAAFDVWPVDNPTPYANGTEVRKAIYKAMLSAVEKGG